MEHRNLSYFWPQKNLYLALFQFFARFSPKIAISDFRMKNSFDSKLQSFDTRRLIFQILGLNKRISDCVKKNWHQAPPLPLPHPPSNKYFHVYLIETFPTCLKVNIKYFQNSDRFQIIVLIHPSVPVLCLYLHLCLGSSSHRSGNIILVNTITEYKYSKNVILIKYTKSINFTKNKWKTKFSFKIYFCNFPNISNKYLCYVR